MFKKVNNSFQQIDLFSQKVELYMKRQADHKTRFGACLSLFLSFIMLYFLVGMLNQMVSRTNPITQQFIQYDAVPNKFTFDKSNFTFVFGLENGTSFQTFLNQSLVQMQLNAVFKYPKTLENGNIDVVFEKSESRIVQPELINYFKTYDLSKTYCVDFDKIDQVFLQGAYDSPEFRYLTLDVNMCSNETLKPGQTRCAPQAEIDRVLNEVIFAWQLSDITVDLSDPKQPHKIVGKDIYTSASNLMFKHIDLYFQQITTNTDFGYVTSDPTSVVSLKYDNYVEQIQLKPSGRMFFRMMFRLGYEVQVNNRAYIKIQDIAGTLGGLWQVLYVIFFFFVAPINKLSQKLILLNSLFNFEGQSKDNDDAQISHLKSLVTNKADDQFQNSPNKLMNVSKALGRANKRESIDTIKNIEKKDTITTQAKERSFKVISKEIKNYFKKTQRRLVLSCYDYVEFFCFCVKISEQGKNLIKKDQIKFSDDRVERSMDILNIIKKLNEIDKLKVLLLNQDQIKLFDYVEKPTISLYPYDPSNLKQHQQYWSILRQDKSNFQAALDAQRAFLNISKNKDGTNSRLLQMLDQKVIQLFQTIQENYFQREEQISLKFSESDCEYRLEDEEKLPQKNQEDQKYIDIPFNNNILISSPRSENSQHIIQPCQTQTNRQM